MLLHCRPLKICHITNTRELTDCNKEVFDLVEFHDYMQGKLDNYASSVDKFAQKFTKALMKQEMKLSLLKPWAKIRCLKKWLYEFLDHDDDTSREILARRQQFEEFLLDVKSSKPASKRKREIKN